MILSRWLLLASLVVLSLNATANAEDAKPGKLHVYFGGYTSPTGSKGIYRSLFDPTTGELSTPELAVEVGSPSFLHIAPDGKTLYAVGESHGKDGGGVFSWKRDPSTGVLSDQVSLTSGGAGPCHISTDAKNQFAVVANYGGGSTAVFTLKPDGSLDKRSAFVQHEGKSINKQRQEGPHAHCGFFSDDGYKVFVCDLGLDQVLLYNVDRFNGTLGVNDPAAIKLTPGAGPRHIHIMPGSNDVAFVNGELDMTINLVEMDLKANKYEVKQTLSTLPEGTKNSTAYSTAEVRIHPNGQFVYVSNRGHNTVAVFSYDAKAKSLKAVGHITGDIKTPRNFNITPCGNWMFIASQDGGSVGVYALDTKTGLAKETKQKVKLDRCVCVKFAPVQ